MHCCQSGDQSRCLVFQCHSGEARGSYILGCHCVGSHRESWPGVDQRQVNGCVVIQAKDFKIDDRTLNRLVRGLHCGKRETGSFSLNFKLPQ